jgi:hypothetical protein
MIVFSEIGNSPSKLLDSFSPLPSPDGAVVAYFGLEKRPFRWRFQQSVYAQQLGRGMESKHGARGVIQLGKKQLDGL